MKQNMSRRTAIRTITGSAASLALAAGLPGVARAAEAPAAGSGAGLKGRINHSVCKWCYGKIPLDEFCTHVKEMGITAIDLLGVEDFPVLKKHGLACAMVSGVPGSINQGLNRVENHDKIVDFFEKTAPVVAEHGFQNIIVFSGNRRKDLTDEEGLEICAKGVERLVPIAEMHKVTIVMELLNSKRDHKGYMCDHTPWGVALCKRVGSERFKLLYDIYHMQIMEGDVIATIKESAPFIAHYHTGGVPGRAEIDESQEIYYPSVMKAIAESGYKGYVAQEFIPRREPLVSLKQAIQICDV